MGAPDLLARLSAMGVTLSRDGDALIARPRSALTDDARTMIRAHKAELLEAISASQEAVVTLPLAPAMDAADARKAHAMAYLEAHPEVKRVWFADAKADPENIVLTVAIREPLGAVEVLVSRAKFDTLALIELSLRYPDTSLFIPEH